jgi:hypothetical protein
MPGPPEVVSYVKADKSTRFSSKYNPSRLALITAKTQIGDITEISGSKNDRFGQNTGRKEFTDCDNSETLIVPFEKSEFEIGNMGF